MRAVGVLGCDNNFPGMLCIDSPLCRGVVLCPVSPQRGKKRREPGQGLRTHSAIFQRQKMLNDVFKPSS